ncbi:acyl-CoA thioesterase [Pseudomonas profundi]|uniref:acyl-CoA thioesterase n=1 Tax=Pseudomonas profundi TaxID=1981513 RepID=UPI00123AD8A5|nr:hypothetical protein [Pseudomonas profundi]
MTSATLFECSLSPRFTDLDTWRHVNNSRIYQLHQEARMRAHLERFGADAWFSDDVRLRPLRSTTDYRLVTWYGSDVQAQVRVLACEDDCYRVRSDLFQNGNHVGSQDCLMGAFNKHERVALPAEVRDALAGMIEGEPEPLPDPKNRDVLQRAAEFPVTCQLTPRYGDLDVDAQRSEAALAQYMEQARYNAVRQLDFGGLGVLVASVDITFEHYRPGFDIMNLAATINRIGNSSFVFTGYAANSQGMQATANSVMVVIDTGSNRPVPIPAALRQQLEKMMLQPVTQPSSR